MMGVRFITFFMMGVRFIAMGVRFIFLFCSGLPASIPIKVCHKGSSLLNSNLKLIRLCRLMFRVDLMPCLLTASKTNKSSATKSVT